MQTIMAPWSLPHLLARMQRLRQMIDKARRQPLASQMDVLRMQALLLEAQRRLVGALVPQAPVPVLVKARHRR
ncbi:MAG: hypothetical protein NW223_03975 [Hyphomicrobiaceae bacterium]|nr:hypothetical protein [Hyphomicrobiaceae bacterium]